MFADLTSVAELSLQFFSSHLALVQLALQALHVLSGGGDIPLPLHQRCPRFIHSVLNDTE